MLNPDLITREELYEAVWSESVQRLAQALGISDVGLAKICKKLNVPRPGLGYWAKSRASRKLLKKPLPPLEANQVASYRITQSATKGGPGWSREALKQLAEEGVAVPTAAKQIQEGQPHPLIATYRGLLEETGLGVSGLLASKACLAVAVTRAELDRGLRILQQIFAGFEAQGYVPEVLAPKSRVTNAYGYVLAEPSRTGVRIKGIFVAFEIKEATYPVEVPPPPQARRSGRGLQPESDQRPTYRQVASGELTLEITDPTPHGMRRRWHEGGTRTLDKVLDVFFRAVMAIAEHEHQETVVRDQRRREEEAAQLRKKAEADRRAELASRMYDLECRLYEVQEARAIRSFARAVRTDAEARDLPLEPDTEVGAWLAWANGLADDLEQRAIQTLAIRRQKPAASPSYGQNQLQQTEAGLRHEVDLWRQRFVFGRG